MSNKSLIMYSRSYGCPFVATARRVLDEYQVSYQEILIDRDPEARRRVLDWTGFESVPTFVIAETGQTLPLETPAPLTSGQSPRGIDRGSMLTEPSGAQLKLWLEGHGLISPAQVSG